MENKSPISPHSPFAAYNPNPVFGRPGAALPQFTAAQPAAQRPFPQRLGAAAEELDERGLPPGALAEGAKRGVVCRVQIPSRIHDYLSARFYGEGMERRILQRIRGPRRATVIEGAEVVPTVTERTAPSISFISFHVHIASSNNVIIHAIPIFHRQVGTVIDDSTEFPPEGFMRDNGDLHYMTQKLANEIRAVAAVRPFIVGENFVVTYDLILSRNIERGGGYHRDMRNQSDEAVAGVYNPFDFITLQFFTKKDIVCSGPEILAEFPHSGGVFGFSPALVKHEYDISVAANRNVSTRCLVQDGSLIVFENRSNIHATPTFGSKWFPGHPDTFSVANRGLPPSRIEHRELDARMIDSLEQDVDFGADTSDDTFDRQRMEIDDRIRGDYMFGEGYSDISPGPRPAQATGSTVVFDSPIAGSPFIDRTPDITGITESRLVTSMPPEVAVGIIKVTLEEQRRFIRGSWVRVPHPEGFYRDKGNVIPLPADWAHISDGAVARFIDARQSMGGGVYGSESTPKSLKTEQLPEIIFNNVFINLSIPFVKLPSSEVKQYLDMEQNFNRLVKGGKRNKKTKKRSKKQTRKRGKIMKNRTKTFSRG